VAAIVRCRDLFLGSSLHSGWVETIGTKTGKLLPTGHAVDDITLTDGKTIQATLCDAGNPCVWIPAEQVGLTGSELSEEINENQKLLDTVRQIRGKAAVAMGLAKHWDHVDDESPGLPMVGMVAAPAAYQTLSGEHVEETQMDLRVRLIFMNRLHESIAGSGSVCLAAASRIPESTVAAVTENRHADDLLIGHPSGVNPHQSRLPHRRRPHPIRRPRLQQDRPPTHGRHGLLPGRPTRITNRPAMTRNQTDTTVVASRRRLDVGRHQALPWADRQMLVARHGGGAA
jgi:hypothetical protein